VIASVICSPASLKAVVIPESHIESRLLYNSRLNLKMPYEPVDKKRDVHECVFCAGSSHVFDLAGLLSNLLIYKRYIRQ
jgi:hypothetical protein